MVRKLSMIGLFLLVYAGFVQGQLINEDAVEIGIIEHLEDTIPLDLTFLDENDKKVSLRELVDKPTVLSFVYFDCPGLCSPLLQGVSEVIGKTDMELGKDYQVITISFNYSDTPEKAREKKENFLTNISKDKSAYWRYLTGDKESIMAITRRVGFKFKQTGVDFAHPSAIIMVSPKGKITRYLYGINFLPFDLKMAIIEAQQGKASPTINKVLNYCFSYDPQGQRYTFEITKIVGTITIIFALTFFLILMLRKKRK